MQDTPENIRQLQLDIWLAKTPAERLEQFITDNDALFSLWKHMKEQISLNNNTEPGLFNNNLHQIK